MTDIEKLDKLLRHIENVRQNCELLGRKLIEAGDVHMGLALIANGQIHDNSKFRGIEWDYLTEVISAEGLKYTVTSHHRTNPHHPEYWNGVKNMPNVYVAEMVCDWKARATEFGSSLREWIDKVAAKRYKFKKGDAIYKRIFEFVEMICDKPFISIDENKTYEETSTKVTESSSGSA